MMKLLGSSAISFALIAGFLGTLTTKEAHAYIDPGSGSLLIQILFAGLFAFLFTAKLFWQRCTGGIARFLRIVKQGKGKRNI